MTVWEKESVKPGNDWLTGLKTELKKSPLYKSNTLANKTVDECGVGGDQYLLVNETQWQCSLLAPFVWSSFWDFFR